MQETMLDGVMATRRSLEADSLGSSPSRAIIAGWRSGLSRLSHKQYIVGSNPTPAIVKNSSRVSEPVSHAAHNRIS